MRDAMQTRYYALWQRYIEQRDEMTTSNILASLLHRKKSTLELPAKPVEPDYPDTKGFT